MPSIKHKNVRYLLATLLSFVTLASPVYFGGVAAAACSGKVVSIPHGKLCQSDGSVTCDSGYSAQYNGSSLSCQKASGGNSPPPTQDPALKSSDCQVANKCTLIGKYVNPLINVLAALVGVAVVISIVIGGIQYASSAGDPQAASAAKNRIRNALIALVTFIFLYGLINFLIPGGLGLF